MMADYIFYENHEIIDTRGTKYRQNVRRTMLNGRNYNNIIIITYAARLIKMFDTNVPDVPCINLGPGRINCLAWP